VTGIVSWILTKWGKDMEANEKSMYWQHLLEIKFLMGCLCTPAVKPLVAMLTANGYIGEEQRDQDEFRIKLQFYLVCALGVMSSGAKSFRENSCNNFEKDPVGEKVL
jgi:hypothetical protein